MGKELNESETSLGSDKGFELLYSKLSPRRKFIRTVWMAPLFLILLLVIFPGNWYLFGFIPKVIVIPILVIGTIIQAYANYKKWKQVQKVKEHIKNV